MSQATVSSVLGGQANGLKISQQTRERVSSVARELGYQRNQLARAMITGKSRILGVLISPDAIGNIIANLAAILFPVFQKVRKSATTRQHRSPFAPTERGCLPVFRQGSDVLKPLPGILGDINGAN